MGDKVLLCVPSYNGEVHHNTMGAVLNTLSRHSNCAYTVMASSFLTLNFNRFWCMALNDKNIGYFVMLHADIAPIEPNWLGKFLRLADDYNADVLSAVSPIKLDTGHTSTALCVKDEPFGKQRRLMMQEINQVPPVFNAKDLAKLFEVDPATATLLTNTGLMCVRMKKRDVLETMVFDVENKIVKNDKGEFEAISQPEDWKWSRDAQDKGLSVYATVFPMAHMQGNIPFHGHIPWGRIEHDGGDKYAAPKG